MSVWQSFIQLRSIRGAYDLQSIIIATQALPGYQLSILTYSDNGMCISSQNNKEPYVKTEHILTSVVIEPAAALHYTGYL